MIIIKIFLASSLTEFEKERLELGDFVRHLNNDYIHRGVYFELTKCEDFSDALAPIRKQDEFNKAIQESQHFYVLVGRDIGDYTLEEFDVALEQFRASGGVPNIHTYFSKLPEGEEASENVKAFMGRLDKELRHFYRVFTHIDSVKFHMLIELTRNHIGIGKPIFENDPSVANRLILEDGQAKLDGEPILSLDRVPIYCKHEELNMAKAKKAMLDNEFQKLRLANIESPEDDSIFSQLLEVSTELNNLGNEIREMEKAILNLCTTIVEQSQPGEVLTWRQKEARLRIDEGDTKGALQILRGGEQEKELMQAESIAAEDLNGIRGHIGNQRLIIDTLKTEGITDKTLPEIIERYENATGLAVKWHVEADVLYDYAAFLRDQENLDKAIETAEVLLQTFGCEADNESEFICAIARNKLGDWYEDKQDHQKAEELYSAAIDSMRRIAEKSDALKDKAFFESFVQSCQLDLANLYSTTQQFEKATKLCDESMEALRNLAKLDPMVLSPLIPYACRKAAWIFDEIKQEERAENLYIESLNGYRKLSLEDSTFKAHVAAISAELASLYTNVKRYNEAEKLYCEALGIYRELAKENPNAYRAAVARVCNWFSRLYHYTGNYKKMKQLSVEAMDVFRELMWDNPAEYCDDFALACQSSALAYYDTNSHKKAEELFCAALDMFQKLAKEDPTWSSRVAEVCNNYGLLLYATQKYESAEKISCEALKIYRQLAESSPTIYNADLALSYYNLGVLYAAVKRREDAEKMCDEALKIYRRLAAKDPKKYNVNVAEVCCVLADLCASDGYRGKAEALLRKALSIYEQSPQYAEKAKIIRNELMQLLN